jgi:pterin-4a-carbinolamine dehydratase
MGGQVVYHDAAPTATDLASWIQQGRMSANPVTALLRTDDVLASWDLFDRLSDRARESAFGPNLLLMYGAVMADWDAHRLVPEPLVEIDGLDGSSYTLRVMAENHGLWQDSYNEAYALLNDMARESA